MDRYFNYWVNLMTRHGQDFVIFPLQNHLILQHNRKQYNKVSLYSNQISQSRLRSRFPYLTENGLDLMNRLLTYDPLTRITAEEALLHPYFIDSPVPQDPALFPTFPSKGAGEKKHKFISPRAPHASHADKVGEEEVEDEEVMDEEALRKALNAHSHETSGFRLRY